MPGPADLWPCDSLDLPDSGLRPGLLCLTRDRAEGRGRAGTQRGTEGQAGGQSRTEGQAGGHGQRDGQAHRAGQRDGHRAPPSGPAPSWDTQPCRRGLGERARPLPNAPLWAAASPVARPPVRGLSVCPRLAEELEPPSPGRRRAKP